MTTMDGSIVSISYPALAATFQVDAALVGWVGIAFFLASTSLLLTMGWVGDSLGRDRLYTLGQLMFTAGLVLAALSQNIPQIIAARAIQGVGSAMMLSSNAAIITAAFPARERGMAFGLMGAVVGLGLGLGSPLGGAILDALDWRALFYTRIPLGVVAMVSSWLLLEREARVPGPLHLDIGGSLLLLSFLGTFLLVINQAERLGITSPLVVGAGILSAVSFPLFIMRERRARHPIVQLGLFRTPTFSAALPSLLIFSQAWSAIAFLMPFAMINGLGYGAAKAGLILSVFSLLRSFTSPVCGWLTDRMDHRVLMGVAMGIFVAALVALSRLSTGTTPWQIVGVLAFASLGAALFEPPNASSIMGAVPRTRLGMAGASMATGRHIGFSVGIALSGAILAARESHYLAVASQGSQPTAETAAPSSRSQAPLRP